MRRFSPPSGLHEISAALEARFGGEYAAYRAGQAPPGRRVSSLGARHSGVHAHDAFRWHGEPVARLAFLHPETTPAIVDEILETTL